MTLPGTLLSTTEVSPARRVHEISVEMLPLQHAGHLENFADNFGGGWLDRQNKQLRLQFNLVVLFSNAKIDRLYISVPGGDRKIVLSPTCVASPGIGKKHPQFSWSAQSRFVVNETIELHEWAIKSDQLELLAEVAGKQEKLGVIYVGNADKGLDHYGSLPGGSDSKRAAAATIVKGMHLFAHKVVDQIRGMNRLFLVTVVLPTLLAVVYFGIIASDVYVCESQFIIRSSDNQSSSQIGALLQVTGLTAQSQDYSATVQNFILSRDALHALDGQINMRDAFSSKDADIFSRFAGLYWDKSFEALYKYYQRFIVDVQIDSTSSIVTLDTRAFTADDSFRMNQVLLEKSEILVNQLSERARMDMVNYAAQEVMLAEKKDKEAALELARIQTESTKGGRNAVSLASKVTEYQRLTLEKGFTDTMLAGTMSTLQLARSEALRQQLYLGRIVQPRIPDRAIEPHRIRNTAATFVLGLIVFGILSILIAGVKEHHDR
jgi:capsular polysaccharide transport system permease protein